MSRVWGTHWGFGRFCEWLSAVVQWMGWMLLRYSAISAAVWLSLGCDLPMIWDTVCTQCVPRECGPLSKWLLTPYGLCSTMKGRNGSLKVNIKESCSIYLKFIIIYSKKSLISSSPLCPTRRRTIFRQRYCKHSFPLSSLLSFSLDFILGGVSGDVRHHLKLQMTNFMLRLPPSAIQRNMPKKGSRYLSVIYLYWPSKIFN